MADEEFTSQDSGTLSESVSVLVIAGSDASYAAESVLGTVPSSDTSNVSESDMNVLTDYSYHNLYENDFIHHDIEEAAHLLSDYRLILGETDTGAFSSSSVQHFDSRELSVLAEGFTIIVQEDETSSSTESTVGTRPVSDAASLIDSNVIEQGYQDSAILSEITNREASYIEFGFVSYKTLVLYDESDTSLRIIESPLMLHRDQDESEGKSDQIITMDEGDLLSLRCYHTYLERHIYDKATFVSGIYYGTMLSKSASDSGRLRTFGSLMIARILGAIPGATIYHETLNMLARMIEIMRVAVTDTFFVPFKEIGEGREKWRGGDQMQQSGTLVENVVAITTSSTDFAALIEQSNLQKM